MKQIMKQIFLFLLLACCMVSTLVLTARASEIVDKEEMTNETLNDIVVDEKIIITYQKGIFAVFQFENSDRQIFCVDRKKAHPITGAPYMSLETVDNLDIENLNKAFNVIKTDKEHTDDYRIAAQCLVWSSLENDSDFSNWALLYGNENAKNIYESMAEEYNTITDIKQYNLEFYISSTYMNEEEIKTPYQRMGTYAVPENESSLPPTDETPIAPELPSIEAPNIATVPTLSLPEETEIHSSKAPKTGDTSNLSIYIVFSFICIFSGIIIFYLQKRNFVNHSDCNSYSVAFRRKEERE